MARSPVGSASGTTGTATTSSTLEIRLAGGIYALNRFLMTLQNKRVPVAGIRMDGDHEASRITLTLDCPEETARRYTALLSSLEDVDEVWTAEEAAPNRQTGEGAPETTHRDSPSPKKIGEE